jgi:hypothetical protein
LEGDGRLSEQFGKMLIGIGLMIALLGVIVLGAAKIPGFRLGRLPGDIAIQREGFSLFFPITTMLLLSAVLSLILFLAGRFRK